MKHFRVSLLCVLILSILIGPINPKIVEAQEFSQLDDTIANEAISIRINEVMFYPVSGGYEWVELKNAGSESVDIRGFSLTDEDNNWYGFPNALTEIPSGGFVVVIFDGQGSGSNDYSFSDNVATLHSDTGLVNIFEDEYDQVALYSINFGALKNKIHLPIITNPRTIASGIYSSPIVSFVAWGSEPNEDAKFASEAGIWNENWYVSLARGTGFVPEEIQVIPDESIGILPEQETGFPDGWGVYQVSETSQGKENKVPVVSWYYPDSGAKIDGETFAISWNFMHGVDSYQFQLDDSISFISPIIDLTLNQPFFISSEPILEGLYYWRVKYIYSGIESAWSQPYEVISTRLPQNTHKANHTKPLLREEPQLEIDRKVQHKDTLMLDLDGSPECHPGNIDNCRARWDSSHETDGDLELDETKAYIANKLDSMYCVQAAISMIVSYYGKGLSQDRISYEIFGTNGDNTPISDLGHGKGVNDKQVSSAISWALGMNVNAQFGKPSFQKVTDWIDENRPILSVIYEKNGGHARVITGYRENNGRNEIYLLDPACCEYWVDFECDGKNFDHVVWVGPAGKSGAPNARYDEDYNNDGEPDTKKSSDGDDICDFDERVRFSNTKYNNLNWEITDSDGDLIPDKLDIRQYLFDEFGNYKPTINPTIDNDDLWKESDPDNDNGGAFDGCEDINHNGYFESSLGETSNFNPLSERECYRAYFDDFSDPGTGWYTSDDSTKKYIYYNGMYEVTVKTGNRSSSVRSPFIGSDNYLLEVDSRLIEGIQGSYGLAFGIHDWTHWYQYLVRSDGKYALYEYNGSHDRVDLKDWTTSTHINKNNKSNHLAVARVGQQITLYVNGYPLFSTYDNSFLGTQRVGVSTFTQDYAPITVTYDNFSVRQMNP